MAISKKKMPSSGRVVCSAYGVFIITVIKTKIQLLQASFIMTMTMDLFQLRAHEGQKIIGEIFHTMIEHN